MSDVFQKSKTEGNARLVLLALADCANPEGICYPSIKTVASMANISEETARKYLHAFEKIGLVRSEERYTPFGRRTSNNYHLNLEKIGDDVLGKEALYAVVHKSRHRSKDVFDESVDGMNQSIGQPLEPVHTYHPMNGVQPSYMNHQKEPKIEPSSDSAIATSESSGIEFNEDLFDSAMVAESPSAPAPPVRRVARKPRSVDDAFITALKKINPDKDIDLELKKARTWLVDHPERKLSRPFFISWINRAKPIDPDSQYKCDDFKL